MLRKRVSDTKRFDEDKRPQGGQELKSRLAAGETKSRQEARVNPAAGSLEKLFASTRSLEDIKAQLRSIMYKKNGESDEQMKVDIYNIKRVYCNALPAREKQGHGYTPKELITKEIDLKTVIGVAEKFVYGNERMESIIVCHGEAHQAVSLGDNDMKDAMNGIIYRHLRTDGMGWSAYFSGSLSVELSGV